MFFFTLCLLMALFSFVKCSSIGGKIVGGQEIDIKNCPYQVSLRDNDNHICGGSILNQNTIITAAHCVDSSDAAVMSIRHGSTYADFGKKHQVVQIIKNPGYDDYFYDDDVALLKIWPPIKFSSSSQPIAVAQRRPADNADVFICGWGVLSEDGDTTNLGRKKLRAVTLQVVSEEICQQQYRSHINEKIICAAAKGKDSCQGDSGGALVDKNTRQLVGISSYGDGCAREDKSGVYQLVSAFAKFIKANL